MDAAESSGDEPLLERVGRAARLEPDVFRHVARDERATGAAIAVVLGASLLEALGRGELLLGRASIALRWMLWTGAIHGAARALGLNGGLSPTFRALGFAAAPFAVGLLQGLPLVGGLAWAAKWLWGGAAFVVATREVTDAEVPAAVGLVVAGGVVALVLVGLGL